MPKKKELEILQELKKEYGFILRRENALWFADCFCKTGDNLEILEIIPGDMLANTLVKSNKWLTRKINY